MNESVKLRHLRELIEALARRESQAHRVGESAIARDAAALTSRALERIAELENQLASAEKV